VKQIWDSVQDELTVDGVTEVSFGATNPRKRFAGMQWFIIPVFSCCSSLYLTTRMTDEGEWQFINCP
jgi:hypothetical protein